MDDPGKGENRKGLPDKKRYRWPILIALGLVIGWVVSKLFERG